MPRIARLVVPGNPHHVLQRGNRSQKTFFENNDFRFYVDLMTEWSERWEVQVWAYCLMPNHVHLVCLPGTEHGLRKVMSTVHARYTRFQNRRQGWRGCLWQGRFTSFVMDESYLLAAARYVEMNPVRAGITRHAGQYPWSSASAHLAGRDDGLVKVAPLLDIVPDWGRFLEDARDDDRSRAIARNVVRGLPLGSEAFIGRLEAMTGRRLHAERPGPKTGAPSPTCENLN